MIRIIEVPQEKLDRKFYQETLKKAIDLFSAIKGVQSIYQFGTVKAPGNSDIDLMFVIEPNKETARNIFLAFEEKFSNSEKYILYQHDPLVINEKLAPVIDMVRPCHDPNHLYGEKIDFVGELDSKIRLYILVELMTQYYPQIFFSSKRDVRLRLQHINAIRFPFKMFTELGDERVLVIDHEPLKPMKRILEENDGLRQTYLRKEYDEYRAKLVGFENTAVEVTKEIIRQINDNLVKGMGRGNKNSRVLNRCFVGEHRGELIENHFGRRSISLWYYPRSFGGFFNGAPSNEYALTISGRNRIIDEYCTFIDQFVGGRNLYYPWWHHYEPFKMRILRTTAMRFLGFTHA